MGSVKLRYNDTWILVAEASYPATDPDVPGVLKLKQPDGSWHRIAAPDEPDAHPCWIVGALPEEPDGTAQLYFTPE